MIPVAISMQCPHCGYAFQVRYRLAGMSVRCSKCEQKVVVPEAANQVRGAKPPKTLAELGVDPRKSPGGAEKSSAKPADSAVSWPPGVPRPRERLGRRARHEKALGMHGMILQALALDGLERAGADVQRDRASLDPGGLQPVQQ